MSAKNIILEDNQLLCQLTGKVKKVSDKENNIQSIIRMLNEEYGFAMDDMERDFNIIYEDLDTGRSKKLKADLVVFEKEKEHTQDHIIRLCIIHDEKVKDSNNKKGVEATVKMVLWDIENCDFALWSNGSEYHYVQKVEDDYGNPNFEDISDFPGEGETIEDIDRPDRSSGKAPVNDSLVRTFKRCKMKFTEEKLELAFIESLGSEAFEYTLGAGVRDVHDNLLTEPKGSYNSAGSEILIKSDLKTFLSNQYQDEEITEDEVNTIIRDLEKLPASDLYESNKVIMKKISDGYNLKREDPKKKDLRLYFYRL